ncbi:M3 family oligoendopeptidase [Turicibacter sanguinis]|uniref:M3 family oligoendopeptidase n=1 Tax=Turicibacter sanguinis TaxID=154288 RepID=UPI0018AB0065|nr:M3 family oligoendopeptidase [Turicibacter sanguinis]MDB8564687.1 M3 family oligoendopeptidase [Turicibacter sanguinis]
MKFNDFKYERPNYEQFKNEFGALVYKFEAATNAEEQLEIVNKINAMRSHIETMATLSSIRHSIDTRDEFYDSEQTYWDEQGPLYEEATSAFYHAIVKSPFRAELEEKLSKQFFTIAEFNLRSFSPEIIADLQEENKLSSLYTKLLASAKIPFDGEERTLPGMGKYLLSEDSQVREEASVAKYHFFEENEAEIDRIYDELVKVRTRIAKKLGFNNFVELGYTRMMRSDYNPEMVKNFRKQVLDYIVPVASSLYKRQEERLGYGELRYFDEKFEFKTGNATPKGSPEWILENGVKMYHELSPQTKEFFDFMVESELLDLVNKPGKAGGGYCTYIPEYKAPFIFSNFNGTAGDIDVLTHEAGHAFQVYSSRWIETPELNFPTYESCEIHSMSMEFFTWPWMELFFKEDTDKYKFTHLGSAIKFIPYGIVVDAFQHFVYENPEATPAERKAAWRNLEKQYLPHKNYEGCDFLERGGWWFQQAHIFNSPFYYIDYTLAQICALQFWKRMHDNREDAWNDYVRLCEVGGTKSFLGLVSYANLKSPFEDGCVSSIISDIKAWLDSVEDQKL